MEVKRMSISKYAVVSGLTMLALATCAFAQPDIPINRNPEPEEIPAPRQGRYDAVESIEVSPDGKWLATTHLTWQYRPEDRTRVGSHARLHVWDVATGELKWSDAQQEFLSLTARFSPDSSHLLLSKIVLKPGAGHVVETQLRESGSGNIVTTLKGGGPGRDGHFTADGKQLVLSISTGLLRLWDAASGEMLPPTAGLSEKEKIIGFSKDGTRVLTSCIVAQRMRVLDSKLAVRSWPDLKWLYEMPLGKTWPDKIAFSPDGTRAAFVHRLSDLHARIGNYEVVIWNIENQKIEPLVLQANAGKVVYDLDFLPDGQNLIGSGRNLTGQEKSNAEIWRWDVRSGELLQTYNSDQWIGKDTVSASDPRFRLAPEGKSVFINNGNNQTEQRLLENGELIRSYSEKDNPQ
jgi:WD40 repeat protein